MERICVFCGSSAGRDPRARDAAIALGRLLAARRIGLVYGGGRVGLMGILADAVLAAGGQVTGVIPKALATREVMHEGLTELHVVDSMHTRKALMASRADGFIALPGGFGTLDELFEIITWAQLGLHRKPVGLLNSGGYYEPLVRFVDQMIEEGFVRPEHRALLLIDDRPAELLEAMRGYGAPPLPKWIREEDL